MRSSTAAAAERVFEFLDEPEEKTEGKNLVKLAHVKGEVEFSFRAVCHPLYGGCQSMDLYRFRRDCRIRFGVADLLPEQEVWGIWADEAFRLAQPSPLPYQPTTHSLSVAAQGAAKTKEKRE